MFRTVPLSITRNLSLYTQQRYMSYRFADSLLASCQQTPTPSWNSNDSHLAWCHETLQLWASQDSEWRVTVSCGLMSYSFSETWCCIEKKPTCCMDWGTWFLQNVVTSLPNSTASHATIRGYFDFLFNAICYKLILFNFISELITSNSHVSFSPFIVQTVNIFSVCFT